ncbi:MAG: PEP/pyruvate-binding domain-containing protein [Thermodesulfobacteriota bacterium]
MLFKFLRRFLKEEKDEQVLLQEKFTHFRRLLDNNNQALETMADMEEKLSGDYVFDTSYLFAQVDNLGKQIGGMVTSLNLLTQNRYRDLVPIAEGLQKEMLEVLEEVPTIPDTPYILPLSALDQALAPAVGGKMANLGEIGNRIGLPVPQGFAITAAAYKRFLESSSLAADIEAKLSEASIQDLDTLKTISRELQAMVLQAPLPQDLEDAIIQAAQDLPTPWLAVRSSAVGEDTEFSFAGQFATLLNVDAASLPRHYKEIVASKFTSRAIFYWKYQQFSVNALPMAVGVLAMVPARASGVMFSLDPHAPQEGTVLISSVWGLGKYAVDGTVSPDLFTVSGQAPYPIIKRRVAQKPVALICAPEGGVEEVTLASPQAQAPSLTDDQVRTLADIALELEEHFGTPQDIEWTVGEAGNIIILQSRPLRLSAPAFAEEPRPPSPEPQAPPLLHYGIRAVGGAAAGRVHHFLHDEDVGAIPPGAVVVARQPSARLVLVMDRIAAIVTEVGSPTDHMTILAREFRVPTLVEVGGATKVLHAGQLVTVDADAALIYPGIIPELLQRQVPLDEEWRSDPVYQKLRRILQFVTRLNLLDPESPDFQAKNCRTLHDITRFSHEKAMDAMFIPDMEKALESGGVRRLKTDLPLNLFILDLGGGLKVTGQEQVTEDDVISRPFRALLRGFHHPQVTWAGQVAPDLKGFISVFANTMYDMAKAERGLGGKSFAIVTENYLNFNSRIGYHFGIVDAYISEEKNDNYISFQFKGGAAGIERRERRARLVKQILDDLGFKAQTRGDLVQGRLVKLSLMETEQTLELAGLLIAFCRQLDLALASDAVAERVLQAFKTEDYSLKCLRPQEAAAS